MAVAPIITFHIVCFDFTYSSEYTDGKFGWYMKENTMSGNELNIPVAVILKSVAAVCRLVDRSGVISRLPRQTQIRTSTTYIPQKKLNSDENRKAESLRTRESGKTTA